MSDWIRMFDTHTSWNELQHIIDDHVERSLATVREQLEAEPMLPALRAALVERFRPLYVTQIREVFEAGWHRLQADAAAEREVVH